MASAVLQIQIVRELDAATAALKEAKMYSSRGFGEETANRNQIKYDVARRWQQSLINIAELADVPVQAYKDSQ